MPTTQTVLKLRMLRKLLENSQTGLAIAIGIVAQGHLRISGRIVEQAPVRDIFDNPTHAYTRGLLGATAEFVPGKVKKRRLNEIPGTVPALNALGPGCAFAPRCTYAVASCSLRTPDSVEVGAGHLTACDQLLLTNRRG